MIIMERIKTETVKFTVKDIEILINKHLIEVEKITGAVEVKWFEPFKERAKNYPIVEVIAKVAVATGRLG